MAITVDDVRHVAALARLGVDDARAQALVAELNAILAHMDTLSSVKTDGVEPFDGMGGAAAPLRADEGPPLALGRALADVAPATRDGFLLVPRLATHEDAESA